MITAALLVSAGYAGWELRDDLSSLRRELLLDEIRGARSRAARLVGRIEHDLEARGPSGLEDVAEALVQTSAWKTVVLEAKRDLYAALVNKEGEIVAHTDRTLQGRRLGLEWYDAVASGLGEEVVHTQCAALTAGQPAFDVYVPICLDGQELGSCHIGLSQTWFEAWAAAAQRRRLLLESLSLGAVVLLAVGAGVSLRWLTQRSASLERAVARTYTQATSELGQLAAGLAHEIRNPLHALRLNLHAFRRTREDRSALSPEEISRMLEQSVAEIDRIDRLLQELIGFASPVEPRNEIIDVKRELEGLVDFVGQELLRNKIEVQLRLSDGTGRVRMDRGRLRQIVLNLLHNARDAMPDGGRIEVGLTRGEGCIDITVSDRGCGIAEADMPHIFEPYFTTSDTGTGLGLALVKRFVREAGGQISCQSSPQQGTRFCIQLREIPLSTARTGEPA